jgi:exonuclease SbcD
VVLIAGNHDGPERLSFGSRLLGRQKLHVLGNLAGMGAPLSFEDRYGAVEVFPVPYADPAVAREWLGDSENGPRDHDQAMRAVLARARAGGVGAAGASIPHAPSPGPGLFSAAPAGPRSILVTHAFVAGATPSESERPLTVGGAGTVEAAAFEAFSYVALGHLHRPQQSGAGNIRYAGSLLKYSFDEADHTKTVDVVELAGDGTFTRESVPLRPRRDVRRISGRFADLLRGPAAAGAATGSPNDYLLVTLLDDGPVLDAMARLREVYPNVLRIDRTEGWGAAGPAGAGASGSAAGVAGSAAAAAAAGDIRHNMTERDLFRAFFTDVTGAELTADEQSALDEVIEDVRRAEREA